MVLLGSLAEVADGVCGTRLDDGLVHILCCGKGPAKMRPHRAVAVVMANGIGEPWSIKP